MILVSEGTRGLVLRRTSGEEPCPNCGSDERDVVVSYQVFGFFKAFCANWGRRYAVECRRCRTELEPVTISTFESEYGNPIPYGHRFGLAALAVLMTLTIAVFASGLRSRVVTVSLLALWVVVGIGCWRTSRMSTFRRRAQASAAS